MKWILRLGTSIFKIGIISIIVFVWEPVELARMTPEMPMAKKGLALTGSQVEDVEKLNAGWWYVYDVWEDHLETDGYVPMFQDGTPNGDLPNYYDGYVLVFNEPSINDISPAEGVQRYLMLLDLYQNANLVVGGAVESNPSWAIAFLSQLEEEDKPERWHVHHYFGNDPLIAMADVRAFYDVIQTPLWITEYGSTVADKQATREFMLFMETTSWIEYYAYFPTRMNQASGDYWWFPSHWSPDMALVDWESGAVTLMGELFRDFDISNIYFPVVKDGGN